MTADTHSFKGSMVLKACLIELGYTKEIGHTGDIDANWISELLPKEKSLDREL